MDGGIKVETSRQCGGVTATGGQAAAEGELCVGFLRCL